MTGLGIGERMVTVQYALEMHTCGVLSISVTMRVEERIP
jgi:hypothetical protein